MYHAARIASKAGGVSMKAVPHSSCDKRLGLRQLALATTSNPIAALYTPSAVRGACPGKAGGSSAKSRLRQPAAHPPVGKYIIKRVLGGGRGSQRCAPLGRRLSAE